MALLREDDSGEADGKRKSPEELVHGGLIRWLVTGETTPGQAGGYIPQEGFGVRLENDIVVTANGPVDLMASTPVEGEEIEELMNR